MQAHVEAVNMINWARTKKKPIILGLPGGHDIVLDPRSSFNFMPEFVNIITPEGVEYFIPWESIVYIKTIPP